MLDKTKIEESITKFKTYYSIITVDKDLTYLKGGDTLTSETIFNTNMYLELYIFLLEYSITWFDNSDIYDSENAPVSLTELSSVIDKGDELVKSLIELPLNY